MVHTLSYLLHALVVLSVSLFITIDAAVPTFLVPKADGSTAPRSVSEDESTGTSILTLEGQDTDGDNLTFSIVSQNPTSPPFELESLSGLLKVPSGLDAEFSTQYEFKFGVRDGSTTTFSVDYVVNIVDVNDNAPEFNPRNYSANVNGTNSNGTSVITVTATDVDVSGNTITYRIVSGNSPAVFALNSSTGVITVSASLNASTNPTYMLIIQASDGVRDAATPATVNIIVTAETTTAPGGEIEKPPCPVGCYVPIIICGILIIVCICIYILHRSGFIDVSKFWKIPRNSESERPCEEESLQEGNGKTKEQNNTSLDNIKLENLAPENESGNKIKYWNASTISNQSESNEPEIGDRTLGSGEYVNTSENCRQLSFFMFGIGSFFNHLVTFN